MGRAKAAQRLSHRLEGALEAVTAALRIKTPEPFWGLAGPFKPVSHKGAEGHSRDPGRGILSAGVHLIFRHTNLRQAVA
jgi:hypothetical protein